MSFDITSQPACDSIAMDVSGGDQPLDKPCRYVHVGVAGNIAYINPKGRTVTKAVTTGIWPFQVKTFLQTGTTATGVFAEYTD